MADQAVARGRPAERPTGTGEQPLTVGTPVTDPRTAAPALPARPDVAGTLPPPSAGHPAPSSPRPVRLAVALWWAGCVAGVLGIVTALLDYPALDRELTAVAAEADPAATADELADGVRATIVVVVGGTGLLIALSLVWAGLVLRRRGWARWALLATALPLLLAVDVTQDMVTGGADLDRIALLIQAGLVVVALAVLAAPPARAWFRRAPD